MSALPRTRALMLFDADCGFCTKTARRVPMLGVDVEIAPMQSVDLAALGVDAARAEHEMPFVDAAGSVSYGHRAWAGILRTGPLPVRLVGRMLGSRAVDPLGRRVYAWVSANRERMPGGTPQCSIEDRPTQG